MCISGNSSLEIGSWALAARCSPCCVVPLPPIDGSDHSPRMRIIRPLPRIVTRPLSLVVLLAWAASMAVLVNRSYLQASPASLATDLARYGSTAVWKGVYYRGEKIGFTVSQTIRTEEGFELQEDGRLQMMLLGADTAAVLRTRARVDPNFALQSFEFSLDPGTGAVQVTGAVAPPTRAGAPHRLTIWVTSGGV